MILSNISQLEEASRSININRAVGRDLDALGAMYGYSNPRIIPDDYWRECIKILSYGAKTTPGVVFDFCEAFFDFWAEVVTYETTLENQTIAGDFHCGYVNRLVRVFYQQEDGSYSKDRSAIHYSSKLIGNDIYLTSQKTGYWNGCRQQSSTNVKVKFLPFIIKEDVPGIVKVEVDVSIFTIPGHYLLEDSSTPRGSLGFNTVIMDFFGAEEGRFADLLRGQYGIYLAGEDVGGEFKYLIRKLVPAGIQVRITAKAWCDELMPFNSISTIKLGGPASGSTSWPIVPTYDDPTDTVNL